MNVGERGVDLIDRPSIVDVAKRIGGGEWAATPLPPPMIDHGGEADEPEHPQDDLGAQRGEARVEIVARDIGVFQSAKPAASASA